jgi:MYXO-CTERM domain-containing protein
MTWRRRVLPTGIAAILLSAAAPALGDNRPDQGRGNGSGTNGPKGGNQGRGRIRSVPEFDPAAGAAIAALVAGGAFLIVRRRRS